MTNILIIEDDLDFAQILKESLEQDDTTQVVDILCDEEQAMSFFQAGDIDKVDCVLLDLLLPQTHATTAVNSLSGLRLVQHLRQNLRYPGTILVVTNSREFSDGQRALAAGCDGYLCKHAPMSDMSEMLSELRLAIKGEVVLVSREMRHVFLREQLSMKEARLMDLLDTGHGWAYVAHELGYKTAKAAANIGYRVFDKLLSAADRQTLGIDCECKRERALERWRARMGPHAHIQPAPGDLRQAGR